MFQVCYRLVSSHVFKIALDLIAIELFNNIYIWKLNIFRQGNPSIVEQTQLSNSNIGSIETKEQCGSLVSIQFCS